MSVSAASATATKTGPLNKLAVAAVILAVIAFSGLWLLGIGVLAVFAVGAGHVSLEQIRRTGERGRWLAIGALCISYALATWALFSALTYIPALFQQ
ncbi:DUF4190 domain-containing protein [Specibacter sp. NPDC078709]|uniref:DUF4190 domain-containing protein n=1 Tax=Specibacter sp. NPDC078709 TaxID=3154364 RepID=UPI003419D5C7